MEEESFEKIKQKAIGATLNKYLSENIKTQERIALRRLLEDLLDEIMKGEWSVFLENSPNNKCNGYYPRYLYTPNAVESLNSRIEQIRMGLGGYFQSPETLEINFMLQIDRLKQKKWRNPIPILRAKAYEILQIFKSKFYPKTQLS